MLLQALMQLSSPLRFSNFNSSASYGAERNINMKMINIVALVLVIVGSLNWGLVGLFNFDLVAAIFGDMSGLSRTVYALVGLSAVFVAAQLPRLAK